MSYREQGGVRWARARGAETRTSEQDEGAKSDSRRRRRRWREEEGGGSRDSKGPSIMGDGYGSGWVWSDGDDEVFVGRVDGKKGSVLGRALRRRATGRGALLQRGYSRFYRACTAYGSDLSAV